MGLVVSTHTVQITTDAPGEPHTGPIMCAFRFDLWYLIERCNGCHRRAIASDRDHAN